MAFVVLVQREPHAGRMGFQSIAQPSTLEERMKLAARMKDELSFGMDVFVDRMDDASRLLYSQLPGPAFVIGPDQGIVAKFPWADATQLESLLAGR